MVIYIKHGCMYYTHVYKYIILIDVYLQEEVHGLLRLGDLFCRQGYIYIELFCDYITKHMLYSPSKIYSVYQLTKALGARRAGLKAFITLTSIAPNSVNTTPVFTDSWFGPAFIFIFRETNNMSHE